MSDASDSSIKKPTGSRVTVRLSDRERDALAQRAEARGEDLTAVIREAIALYLEHADAEALRRAEQERLTSALNATVKREADRVIDRHEQTTRALIAALNEHLAGNKEPS